MKEFDPHSLLLQYCKPLAEEFLKSTGRYRMVAPYNLCCWEKERGFYLQPILSEFSFKAECPIHESKKTFMLARWNPNGPFKQITDLDGQVKVYPVLAFYICVNRDRFPPLTPRHNEIEWLTTLTERTKGIAHELLYADHYAKYFDATTGSLTRQIEIPNVDQEDALLCPSYQIESTLHSIEKEFAIEFNGESDFLQQQATTAVQKYYHLWLKHYGVERDICHRRTCAYLRSPIRAQYGFIENTLKDCATKHNLGSVDSAKLHRHVYNKTDFATEFLTKVKANGCDGCSDSEILKHTDILLKRKKS